MHSGKPDDSFTKKIHEIVKDVNVTDRVQLMTLEEMLEKERADADRKAREEERAKAEKERAEALAAAEKKKAEAVAAAKKEAAAEKTREDVLRMHEKNCPIDLITYVTGLSKEEIENMIRKAH